MNTNRNVSGIVLVALTGVMALATSSIADAAEPQFSPLPVPTGSTQDQATGVNVAGHVAGIYYDAAGLLHTVLWVGENVKTIDHPNALATYGLGINDCDQIVGAFEKADQTWHGFVWNDGSFTDIDFPGVPNTWIEAVANGGTVLVGSYYHELSAPSGFVFRNGKFTTVQVPGSTFTEIHGISGTDTIVGDYQNADGVQHSFVAHINESGAVEGPFDFIDVPGATLTSLTGVNEEGLLAGYYNDAAGVGHGFTRKGGILTTLNYPGEDYGSYLFGENAWGEITGEYFDANYALHAFVVR